MTTEMTREYLKKNSNTQFFLPGSAAHSTPGPQSVEFSEDFILDRRSSEGFCVILTGGHLRTRSVRRTRA